MQIIYIVLAGIVAVLIAIFHYSNSLKQKKRVSYLLAFLRFIAIFSLFLIFINPAIEQSIIEIEKSSLVVAVDNSSSIKQTGMEVAVADFIEKLKVNVALNNKFKLQFFQFGSQLHALDSLSFDESGTNISKPFVQFKSIYKDKSAPVLLITDGNQTEGFNYEYIKSLQPIYTVVVGDTIKPIDLKISQLNVNRYAYLMNKFPIEVYVNYNGSDTVKANFVIYKGKQKMYSEVLKFSEEQNSHQINTRLLANKVGTQVYSARIENLKAEQNSVNNSKDFVVEVIDEQSSILLLTSLMHPDIGSLKESIESNKQRKVVIKNIRDSYNLEDFQFVILYQPTNMFKTVFHKIQHQKLNHFIITGTKTEWDFLNRIQSNFSKKTIDQTERYGAKFNPSFADFSQDDIGFESFPPLEDLFGEVSFTAKHNILLWQQLGNFQLETPLLSTYENNGIRSVVLFGENFWKWRMMSYVKSQSFIDYDNFTAKLMQYLSVSKRIKRLTVESAPIYYSNNELRIEASYLNKNYEFESDASLWIDIVHKDTNVKKRFPFSLKTNSYSVVLSDLDEGDYRYTVSVENQMDIKKGDFRLVYFDVEQQFSYANIAKLRLLSEHSKGEVYALSSADVLVDKLVENEGFRPIQRIYKKNESLIEWEWLLGLIMLSLALEWFIRKYKGLI